MTLYRLQCYRRRDIQPRPLHRFEDVGRILGAYYARYYGVCRDMRRRTLIRKADEMWGLFDETL